MSKLLSICFTLLLVCICIESQVNHRLHVRKSVSSMTQKEWSSLRLGFQRMKARMNSDRTSFYYQMAVHGWPTDIPDINQTLADEKNWYTGQHSNWWFLSWHRMYLYYYERILRSATGDPDLTLPYWDYYVESNRYVPEAYRIPADELQNGLYKDTRCESANRGDKFYFDYVDHILMLTQLEFISTPDSVRGIPYPNGGFDGVREEVAVFFGANAGAVQDRPHSFMHTVWGGPKSNVVISANDPLFFLHHANVDRLWSTWLSQNNRHNPTEELWLNYPFNFFDENGQKVTITTKDVLYSERQLGYTYETLAELPNQRQQFATDVLIGSITNTSYTSNPLFISLNTSVLKQVFSPTANLIDAEFRIYLSGLFNFDLSFITIYIIRPQSVDMERVSSIIFTGPIEQTRNVTTYFRFPPDVNTKLLSITDWSRAEYFTVIIVPTLCDEVIGFNKSFQFNVSQIDLFLH